ncbi:hypothetical protein DAMA08_014380 [Martiniozyma asiatica (nom. inval.)]|nr:hypothetical protein DAMA08_014380 [Martiniozyma asiatica]
MELLIKVPESLAATTERLALFVDGVDLGIVASDKGQLVCVIDPTFLFPLLLQSTAPVKSNDDNTLSFFGSLIPFGLIVKFEVWYVIHPFITAKATQYRISMLNFDAVGPISNPKVPSSAMGQFIGSNNSNSLVQVKTNKSLKQLTLQLLNHELRMRRIPYSPQLEKIMLHAVAYKFKSKEWGVDQVESVIGAIVGLLV